MCRCFYGSFKAFPSNSSWGKTTFVCTLIWCHSASLQSVIVFLLEYQNNWSNSSPLLKREFLLAVFSIWVQLTPKDGRWQATPGMDVIWHFVFGPFVKGSHLDHCCFNYLNLQWRSRMLQPRKWERRLGRAAYNRKVFLVLSILQCATSMCRGAVQEVCKIEVRLRQSPWLINWRPLL